MYISVGEQLDTDQTDPWQVVPRQVFTPYDYLLISVAFVVLSLGKWCGVFMLNIYYENTFTTS